MTQPSGTPDPSGQNPQQGRPAYSQQSQRRAGAVEAKGFFGALFDFSFQSFITVKFATFIYIVLLVFLALGWLVMIIAGFAADAWAGVLALLLGWIPAAIYLILIRIMLEFFIAMVRTSQNTAGTQAEVETLRREMQQRR